MSMESPTQVQGFDWKQLFFSFEGRARRSHFWIGWLVCLGLGVVFGWLPLLGLILSIALIWPNLAITVKRLHDMGHSGWLAAIPYVVGIVGGIVAFIMIGASAVLNASALENEDPAAIFGLIAPAFGLFGLMFLVGFGFLLWIGVTDSQRGDNRYGPDPKAGL
jgi:uncharacterized membrane protein YhaH (DUF805 family)